jgi:hypothetical protein
VGVVSVLSFSRLLYRMYRKLSPNARALRLLN